MYDVVWHDREVLCMRNVGKLDKSLFSTIPFTRSSTIDTPLPIRTPRGAWCGGSIFSLFCVQV